MRHSGGMVYCSIRSLTVQCSGVGNPADSHSYVSHELPVRRCGLVQADVSPGSNLLQEQPTEQRIVQGDSEAVDRGQVVGEYDRSGLNTNMEMVGLCCRHVSPFPCTFGP